MRTPDRHKFRDALQAALTDARMTQADLVRELGLPHEKRKTVARWFNKKNPAVPSIDVVVKVAHILKVSPAALTVHLGVLPATEDHVSITTPEDAVLADPDLSRDQKKAILNIIAQVRRG